MANGDIAAALGWLVLAQTKDLRHGYDDINYTLDRIAAHQRDGGHTATKILNKSGGNVQADLDFLGRRIDDINSGSISRPGQSGSVEQALLSVAGTANDAWNRANNAQGSANQANQTADAAYRGRFNTEPYNRSVSGQSVKVAYLGNSGELGFSSSSETVKRDIEPFDVPDAVLAAVQLVTYRYRSEADDAPLEAGVIAERLIEAGLPWLVFHDDEGNPQGVHYERLALALLPALQRQMQRTDDLERRLSALEAQKGA